MGEPVTGEEWQRLGSEDQAVTPILACRKCRRTKTALDGGLTDWIPSGHCGDCPPWRCEDCGETCSAKALCSCWTDLTTMAHADVKALFARDGMFNVAPDGRLSTSGPPCSGRHKEDDCG